MKRINVLLIALWGIVSLMSANEPALITIGSDGMENSYLLASVQQVVFNESQFSTMSIEKKDGSVVNDVRTLLFGSMQDVPTSVEDNAEAMVYVYPNPVVSTLYVNGISADETLSVFNLSGKCVIKTTGNEVNVNELPDGTYLLQFNNQCVKFIKH
jgi:hypothetical protein